jgi:hypothetical protein
MKLTKNELDWLDGLFEEMDRAKTDADGGYPGCVSYEIPGYVIRASVDYDDTPILETWTVKALKKEIKECVKLQKENSGMSRWDVWVNL